MRVLLMPRQWKFERRPGAGVLVSFSADFTGDTLWRRWHLVRVWPLRKAGLQRTPTRG